MESFPGAWQQGVVNLDKPGLLAFAAVYSCVAVISADIAKLRLKLLRNTSGNVWVEDTSPAFSPVLRKPNHYQTRVQFVQSWISSNLIYGNAYILKERDGRGLVVKMHVLNAGGVMPMVAPDSSVFYQIQSDNLAGVPEGKIMVPASEIIHDREICLFHPLVGVPPLYAAATSGTQGTKIQSNSSTFFANMSRPSGQLTAPGEISDATAARLKEQYDPSFSGPNIGKLLVSGSGLKFEPFTMPAEQSQLIEQLKWTGEDAARAFNVPLWKIGLAPVPTNLPEADQDYYKTVLQKRIESLESCLDEGLALPADIGVECDLDQLLRMDKKRASRREVGTGRRACAER
jgi:HK97 family phage portal protein